MARILERLQNWLLKPAFGDHPLPIPRPGGRMMAGLPGVDLEPLMLGETYQQLLVRVSLVRNGSSRRLPRLRSAAEVYRDFGCLRIPVIQITCSGALRSPVPEHCDRSFRALRSAVGSPGVHLLGSC